MFLIMGIQEKNKVVDCTNTLPCHKCDGKQGYGIYSRYKYFHIFFLPVWTWGYTFNIKCNRCGTIYNIKRENQQKLKDPCVELTYWDLEPMVSEQYSKTKKSCDHCGYEIDEEFEFCPKCGTQINR